MGQDAVKRKDEELTGTDLPNADGFVSDEDVNAITDKGKGKTGQDHSVDRDSIIDSGVGGVQDSSDPSTDVAHIVD